MHCAPSSYMLLASVASPKPGRPTVRTSSQSPPDRGRGGCGPSIYEEEATREATREAIREAIRGVIRTTLNTGKAASKASKGSKGSKLNERALQELVVVIRS